MLHTRTDGRLFNLARLRAKRNLKVVTIRDILFADDAAFVAHSGPADTTVSVFIGILGFWPYYNSLEDSQGTDALPSVKINGKNIENVKNFVYLVSNVASNASLDTEINIRIGNASGSFAGLTARV